MLYKFLKIFFLFLLFSVNGASVYAYTVYASCPNFTDLTATYIEATTGTFSNPFSTLGVVNGRHTLMATPGTDPRTGNQLQLIAPFETEVIKLGNESVGAQAESMTYHFMVDEEKSILQVKFAVVFEDPQHDHSEQPRFTIRIMDKFGNIFGECSEYDVTSSANIRGFQEYRNGYNTPVQWRDWSTLVIDLSRYAGQEVQVEFVTYDCSLSGHYGYAYFTARCMNNQLSFTNCSESQITATAPPGFESYLWDNGETTQSSTRTLTIGQDLSVSCRITTNTGCSYVLNGYVSGTPPITESGIINDTICEGEAYVENNFNIPPIDEIGDYTYYNTFVTPASCGTAVTITLHLLVVPRYKRINAAICYGQNYTNYGFNITGAPVGMNYDTLRIARPGTCDSLVVLELMVNTVFNMGANNLEGETSVCVGSEEDYSFVDNDTTITYNWNVPPFATIVRGQGTKIITVRFNEVGSGNISMTGSNGCGSGTLQLPVTANPIYNIFMMDTICAGESYAENGFVLPVQDSAGSFVFINRYETIMGCDSARVLSLQVRPVPRFDIFSPDSMVCLGDSTTLNAVSMVLGSGSYIPLVSVGDILCTDNTTVKPADFASSGKIAAGVVFYVDKTGSHGWAVSKNQVPSCQFSTVSVDVASLTNYSSPTSMTADVDGYANTQKWRNAGSAVSYPAAYAVDFANGWYIPAFGQIKILFAYRFEVIASLGIIGGTATMNYNTIISSTESSSTTRCGLSDAFGFCGTGISKTTNTAFYAVKTF